MRTIADVKDGMTIISIVPDSDDRTPFTEALDLLEAYEPENILAKVHEWEDFYEKDPRTTAQLALALNWKGFQYMNIDKARAHLYFALWEDLDFWAQHHYKGDDFTTYRNIVD